MELKLSYTEGNKQIIAGAFVPGVSAADWFQELNRWQTDISEMRCFAMPQNINNTECIGLFVIFGKQQPPIDKLRYPYSPAGNKLFIPFNAELKPVVSTDELDALLLWDIQVFHPVIGLVGFEDKDGEVCAIE